MLHATHTVENGMQVKKTLRQSTRQTRQFDDDYRAAVVPNFLTKVELALGKVFVSGSYADHFQPLFRISQQDG